MSDNKPPMTVWLTDDAYTAFEYGMRGVCRDSKDNVHNVGPYVHLKQFMEEVERRASRSTFPHFDNDEEHTHKAMQELAKEIMEGKP
jgi:hypothetical protein